MADPRWLDENEARMWRSYLVMRRNLDRAMEQQLADQAGLSSADWALLVPLSEAPQHRLRARDLGVATGWDRSRLSHHVRRMEERDLVERRNCPTDARGTFVHLTGSGLQAVERAAPGHVETVRRYLVDLMTPAEIATLTAVSERVVARIAQDLAATDGCDSAGASNGARAAVAD